MLEVKIKGQRFTKASNFSFDNNLDSVASTFTLDIFYDPANSAHRDIVRPGEYPEIEVLDDDVTIATGVVVSQSFSEKPETEVVSLDCYTATGVLEDCQIPPDLYPLEYKGQSLENLVGKFLQPFGLSYKVDAPAKKAAAKAYPKVDFSNTETVAAALSNLASQKNLILSHTPGGSLLVTKAQPNQAPLGLVTEGKFRTGVEFEFDGQSLSSEIICVGQQQTEGGNARQAKVTNPLIQAYRPAVVTQTTGDDTDSEQVAKNTRSEQLKALNLKLSLDDWYLKGQLLRTNQVIKVLADRLFIREPANFLIKKVNLEEGVEGRSAQIEVSRPEVYTGEQPQQIFS
jgi:prophage tail gpP-like protein